MKESKPVVTQICWFENRDKSILTALVGFFPDYHGFIGTMELIISPNAFSSTIVRFGIEKLIEEV